MKILVNRPLALVALSIAFIGCVSHSPADEVVTERPGDAFVNRVISINFPTRAYTYTQAEAAKGIAIGYAIVVKADIDKLYPRPQDFGAAAGPGPSGMYPFEKLTGNGQSYSLHDVGLGQQVEPPARKIAKGVYRLQFKWDGRNWTGPSDFGNPKGKPFPPGDYTLEVRIVGEVDTPDGKQPFQVVGSVPMRLTK